MAKYAVVLAVWLMTAGASAAPALVDPYETADDGSPRNGIDPLVTAALQAKGIEPAALCSDAVFLRRAYLDVIGTLPPPQAARDFLQDTRPDKRARLVNALLEREEFADYWAMKWSDILRVKSEFPINLWPNAAQAYHRWIRDSIRNGKPYDQFARELLTSSGSNFRVGPVNFYRAVQGREPAAIAEAVALTFMGARIKAWPEAQRAGMAAFFSRVAFKKTDEWKEEIVALNPEPFAPLDATFPDGKPAHVAAGDDPRQAFADWLATPENPWFARNAVNRVWGWLMGRGIVHETDDIRPDNPPSNPALLACLEKELVNSKFDLRSVYRLILNSRTYQQSCIPRSDKPEAETLFACYPVRRLDAEVLIDALSWVGGTGQGYTSAVPEPFTYVPEYQRAITLPDGSITSPFLEMFGRPPRDTGYESERNNQPTDAQRLHLLNSTDVQRKVARTGVLQRLAATAPKDPLEALRLLYLTLLSRYPTDAEVAAVRTYAAGDGANPRQVGEDLAWVLVNSKEFLYRH